MLRNYIKLAFRNLIKNKGFTFLNISGLAIALACGMIGLLFILDEYSYDDFHVNKDRIYRVLTYEGNFDNLYGDAPVPLGAALVDNFPEIQMASQLIGLPGKISVGDVTKATAVKAVDASFFKVFTFPVISGDISNFGEAVNEMILTEKTATTYFGDYNPIGSSVTLSIFGEERIYNVVAVIEDPPDLSSIYLNILIPIDVAFKAQRNMYGDYGETVLTSWTDAVALTYLLADKPLDLNEFQSKLEVLTAKHIPEDEPISFEIQSMSDFRLHSRHIANNGMRVGNIKNVYIFGAIALLILILAAGNYTLLSTAQSFSRYKEVGLRKVVGAGRGSIILQFLTDSIVTTLITVPIAILIVELFLPVFNEFVGFNLEFTLGNNWLFLFFLAIVTSVIGLVSGSYLAFFLSSLRPIDILSNKLQSGRGKHLFRRALIVGQIAIFIFLIGSTGVIHQQIKYIMNYDFGYSTSNILTTTIYGSDNKQFATFKQELEKIPGVVQVSGAQYLPPTQSKGQTRFPRVDDPTQIVPIETIVVDPKFCSIFEIPFAKGRDFSSELDQPGSYPVILNETAVEALGMTNPIGQEISGYRIIGIVKDFHVHALKELIGPVMINCARPQYIREVAVKIDPAELSTTVEHLKEEWKQLHPSSISTFQFYDETLELIYNRETKLASIFSFATSLAIFIACMGLIGLSAFTARQRKKEIGIRKVLGASVSQIVRLQVFEFIFMAIIAGIIAWPLTHLIMNRWLEEYPYHTDVGFAMPLAGLLLGIVIAMVAVSLQSLRAATANPVDAIKYE